MYRHLSWSLGLLVVALLFGAPMPVLAAAKSKKLNSDLVAAAEAGETQKVKALLHAGAEVNGKGGEFGWTALMSATREGHLATTKALLEAGAEPNLKTDEGGTAALCLAATHGHLEVVEALVKAGGDITLKDDLRWNPLMCAAGEGQTAAVKTLIQAGSELNERDINGDTALGLAVKYEHPETAEVLRKAGAKR